MLCLTKPVGYTPFRVDTLSVVQVNNNQKIETVRTSHNSGCTVLSWILAFLRASLIYACRSYTLSDGYNLFRASCYVMYTFPESSITPA